ncbi:hypothetical protein P8452_76196 [Trifolium repens]|nr:hypothetical protein P8452_76196 [Trifolium repens]
MAVFDTHTICIGLCNVLDKDRKLSGFQKKGSKGCKIWSTKKKNKGCTMLKDLIYSYSFMRLFFLKYVVFYLNYKTILDIWKIKI